MNRSGDRPVAWVFVAKSARPRSRGACPFVVIGRTGRVPRSAPPKPAFDAIVLKPISAEHFITTVRATFDRMPERRGVGWNCGLVCKQLDRSREEFYSRTTALA